MREKSTARDCDDGTHKPAQYCNRTELAPVLFRLDDIAKECFGDSNYRCRQVII